MYRERLHRARLLAGAHLMLTVIVITMIVVAPTVRIL